MRQWWGQRSSNSGFTLVELLITIVVVGILVAVAIVGIGGLVDNGTNAACQSSLDAAKTAATVHFVNTGSYPQSFTAMTAAPYEFEVPGGLIATATTLKKGTNWTLTLEPHGVASRTTFSCS